MVDAALDQTGRRLRLLPARVTVYLLLAAGLFAPLGWNHVWRRLTGGLGPPPLKALFDLLASPTHAAHRCKGLLVCSIDGTLLDIPAPPANQRVHRSSGVSSWAGVVRCPWTSQDVDADSGLVAGPVHNAFGVVLGDLAFDHAGPDSHSPVGADPDGVGPGRATAPGRNRVRLTRCASARRRGSVPGVSA